MSEQNDKGQPQSRVKKNSYTLNVLAIVIAIILVLSLAFYFYQHRNSFISGINAVQKAINPGKAQQQEPLSSQLPGSEKGSIDGQHGQGSSPTRKEMPNPEGGNLNSLNGVDSTLQNNNGQVNKFVSPASLKSSKKGSTSQSSVQDPHILIDEINSFYTHLDQQPYMQSFGFKESSKAHFSKLLQKLVNNPPVVIRETDDLFTLLQNTAHFFRILGKDNINMLKTILEKEGGSFEKMLNAFYSLTYHPEYLEREYSLSIPAHSLTDYAGFFLNTMGGRLYLFRRDSTSRMVVSYYAIITIDRANDNGNGRHGIDLRPAILSLIDEIEIGGSRLQLKDEYLDTLYDLQVKYN